MSLRWNFLKAPVWVAGSSLAGDQSHIPPGILNLHHFFLSPPHFFLSKMYKNLAGLDEAEEANKDPQLYLETPPTVQLAGYSAVVVVNIESCKQTHR